MSYSPHAIRNICLLGHGGNGKTTLVESFLRTTGVIDRLGKTSDGNTVSDYDPEEIKRQISISASVIPVEYNGCKINVLDTPGNFDFAGEVVECLSVADAGILVCAAKGGLSVGTERAWKLLNERKMPRLIYISKMDEDNVDFNSAFDTLREHFGKNIAPMVVPIWDENKKVTGIADVLHKRAFELHDGKRVEIEVPEEQVRRIWDACDDPERVALRLPIYVSTDTSGETGAWKVEGRVEAAVVAKLLGKRIHREGYLRLYYPDLGELKRLIPDCYIVVFSL